MNRSFFYEAEAAAGATFSDWFGVEGPSHFGNDAEELRALRNGSAFVDLAGWCIVSVKGKDARDYLHRRLSNHVKKLHRGESVYATLMGGDGRMITDLTVADLGEEQFYIIAPPAARDSLAPNLERYVITEDVTVTDLSVTRGLLCAGNNAAIEGVSFAPYWPLGSRVYVADNARDPWTKLRDSGLNPAGQIAWNTMRIEDGIPLFGSDMDTSTIPLEANLEHAIDFNKGCFPGQEIVARINNLGHPAKKLVGLKFAQEDLPIPGTEITWGGKTVGRITSSCLSHTLKQGIALGYLKWDLREPGTTVEVLNSDGPAPAVVCELPFVK